MKDANERMEILAAYQEVGTYRGAAEICGTTHRTVKRIVERHNNAGDETPQRKERERNYDSVRQLVVAKVDKTHGRISAKRLLPTAKAAGYDGSPRNFRRLVAEVKNQWRQGNHRGRRPAVWTPGDTLVIDWGVLGGLHVFCAVLAWSRIRFIRFATDERAATTLRLLAECFETLGGVPRTVLADRMGCLKAGTVANLVVPTAEYVRFATHYGFRPDFCNAADPASKGIVENLVGYAKDDLMIPAELTPGDLDAANTHAIAWCAEVNARTHSEICAIPAMRLESERELLGALPGLRPEVGLARPVTRKVDRLSCIRYGSARYSVPNRLIGKTVLLTADERKLLVIEQFTGEIVAEHAILAPGETSILDEHYGSSRPDKPRRAPRAKTRDEKAFLALGPAAEAFLAGAAAAGVANLAWQIAQILQLRAAHGENALVTALNKAVQFKRWRCDDVRSILATAGAAPVPTPAGNALVLTLPQVPVRPLSDYAIGEGSER